MFSGIDRLRLRGNLGDGEAKWGFINSSGDGEVSNAVVLGGEKVVIYVAPLGHGVGYFGDPDDGVVFMRSRIRITLYDTLRGVEKSVTFDDFSSPSGDAGRYFTWEVGGVDGWTEKTRGATGLSGLFVLRVSDESEGYRRADLTGNITIPVGSDRSDAYLQVLGIGWTDVLGTIVLDPANNTAILEDAEFRIGSIDVDTTMTEAEIYDSLTVFPLFEPSGGMTDEQKTTVIRDNAMFVLSTQLPLLPADAPEAPIVGLGIESVESGNIGVITAARPAVLNAILPATSRLFSLAGKPVATNTFDVLSDITKWHDQGDFRLRDPARVLSVNFDGSAGDGFDGGIGWLLTGFSIGGATFAGGESCETEILLGDEGYEVTFEGDFVSSSSSSTSQSNQSTMSSRSSLSSFSSVSSISSSSSSVSFSSQSSLSSTSSSSPSSLSSNDFCFPPPWKMESGANYYLSGMSLSGVRARNSFPGCWVQGYMSRLGMGPSFPTTVDISGPGGIMATGSTVGTGLITLAGVGGSGVSGSVSLTTEPYAYYDLSFRITQ